MVPLQRLQILNQVGLLLRGQAQPELGVVVIHYVEQRGETPIMVKTASLVRPQPLQRGGAVLLVRCTVRLEVVNTQFLGGMHVPTGFSERRWNVAGRAVGRLS